MAASGTGAYESGGNLDSLVAAIGAIGNTSVTDPTQNATVVSAIKGLINVNVDNYVLLASGVVTANNNSFDAVNYRGRGLKLFIATGAFGASESTMTVTIQGKDIASGTYYNILTSASLSTNTNPGNSVGNILTVYPGLTAVANQVVSDILPKTWRVTYQASNWGTGGSTLGIAAAIIV